MSTTVGGALFGLIAALIVLLPWYRKSGGGAAKVDLAKGGPPKSAGRGGRNWKQLGPFGFAFAIGTLCSLCSGGLLGAMAHQLGNGSSSIGSNVLAVLTGAASPAVARHAQQRLTAGGAVVLVLLVVGAIVWWRGSGRGMHRDLLCGMLSGVTLGPTAGIGGLAAVALSPVVDQVGGWLVGLL
ncbi:hypothetical protein ABIA32_002714 [Streptacidiphilus sp. MAP12-20]|uniref:hypothetical protein n=1 Tax=Streptacidiphilus sp. MAP12-20 TaxID=3156299 RepID=UPI00351563D8